MQSARLKERKTSSMLGALRGGGVGLWNWDIRADRVVICPVTASLFGVSETQGGKGIRIDDCIAPTHPADIARRKEEVWKAMTGHQIFNVSYRTIDADGDVHPVLSRGSVVRDELTGELRGSGVVIDLTSMMASKSECESGYRPELCMVAENLSELDRFADLMLQAWRSSMMLEDSVKVLMIPHLRSLFQAVWAVANDPSNRDFHA